MKVAKTNVDIHFNTFLESLMIAENFQFPFNDNNKQNRKLT